MYNYSTSRPNMLLHACCATCLLSPYHTLKDDFDITVFFYNPNIYPRREYYKRLKDVRRICSGLAIPLIEGAYNNRTWMKKTAHFSKEPEGGKRCGLCFDIRLEKTAITALKKGFDIFGTTLTVSPHKNQQMVNSAGFSLAEKLGIQFYKADFKKRDGFKKTIQLSKELNIYRQSYCGCIYSMSHLNISKNKE